MLLKGRNAIVTGGTSGIGLATATRLAREGASVGIIGSQQAKATEAAREIERTTGTKVLARGADITDGRIIHATIRQFSDELGGIDILVNSAGVWFETPIGAVDETDFDRMVDVNLKGTYLSINAVVPEMKARGAGNIVNIASIAGLSPSPRYSLYSTTKAAIIMLTKSLALELSPFDIRVNAIAPGNTMTPMNHAVREDAEFAERRDWIRRTTPSNRNFTPPEEIAEAVLFLVDGRVSATHGTTLVVDEGRHAGIPAR